MQATDDAELLRSVGLRATGPRLAVLAALRRRPHADADTVARIVRAGDDATNGLAVSTQAVYDVLRVLTGRSLARRIEPAGSSAVYELRVADNHHHVVCRRCGAVADVDCVIGPAPCLAPSDTSGFVVDEAEITFWGVCADCRSDPMTDTTAMRPTDERNRR